MRTLTILATLVLIGGLATSAWAEVKAPTDTPAVNCGAISRYRYQGNHWWYYQTNNQWLGWNGRGWVSAAEMAKAPDLAPIQTAAPVVTYRQPTVYEQPTSSYQSPSADRQDNWGRPGTGYPYPILPGLDIYQDPSLSQPVTGSGQR